MLRLHVVLSALGLIAVPVLAAGCGGQSSTARPSTSTSTSGASAATATTPAPAPRPRAIVPVVTAPLSVGPAWTVVATVQGQAAAWIAERGGVTLLRFDQRLARLALHAGSEEPGGSGWHYGAKIGPHEVHRVIAAFNSGFKFSYGSVGFMAQGRVRVPLSSGLGSVVTYTDGSTQIGAWHEGVPSTGKQLSSVRQNLHLLIDHGRAAASVEGCVIACWGRTLGGGDVVARSALGIDRGGELVWAAGESLSPAALAGGLLGAGVQRAVELDINPYWVAGYLYVHHAGGPSAVPVVPGQHGIAGELLEPDQRDFFTVLAR
jgi:hypothetical protein